MFWKKNNKPSPAMSSAEFETINKRIAMVTGDINLLEVRLTVVETIAKSNRSRLNRFKIDKELEDIEKDIKEDSEVYLGSPGRVKP